MTTHEFFKDESKYYLWRNFKNLLETSGEEELKSCEYTFSGLEETTTAKEIAKNNNPFTLGEVASILESKKDLLSNGFYNLFLVKDNQGNLVLVYADWNSGDRQWYLVAFDLSYEWSAGARVFSRKDCNLEVESLEKIDTLSFVVPKEIQHAIEICKTNGFEVIKKF